MALEAFAVAPSPMAVVLLPVIAWAFVPRAVEFVAFASALRPTAVASVPIAEADSPTAVVFELVVAWAFAPTAVELVLVASAL